MRTITALHLRKKLGEILDRASLGERIVIERDHKPLAMLVSYEEGMRLEEPPEERSKRFETALDRLAAFRERMAEKYGTDGPSAVEMIRMERARDDPPEE